MGKKIVATVIYNIVFWGIFLLSYVTFQTYWGASTLMLYSICMPLFFHIFYFAAIPKKYKEIKWRVLQVFIQIVITVITTIIVYCCIKSYFGFSGLFKPGGVETFHSCCIGVVGTIIYIFTRIGTAFLE